MRRSSLVLLLSALFARAATGPGPAPRFDAWKIIGPGGGGTMIAPTISPHDPRIVFEHCDMTGAYVTLDGGLSWRMFNLYGVVNRFAYDPSDPKVVYAGNWALWRSEDTGKTWRMIFPDPESSTIRTRGDHAETYADTRDPAFPKNAQVYAIVVDGDSLFVAFGGQNLPSRLFVSNDRGAHWERPRGLGDGKVLQLYRDAPKLYAVGEHGVDVQTALGWQRFPAPGKKITSASIGPGGIIYAVADGLFVSQNGGQTWTAVKQALGRPVSVACSAKNPRTAYAGFSGLKTGSGPENLFNGIAKTTDSGATWTVVHKESNRPSENLKGSWIEARAVDGYPNIWFDSPYTLGVAPSDPNICYATDLFRTYSTNDGGKTWTEVNSVQVGPDRWTTRGLDVTTNYGVQFDPFDSRHIFIDYTDIGLFQSGDGGASWTGSTAGLPSVWRNTTYWVQFDPKVRGLMWGAFAGTHDLPRPKMWQGTDPASFTGGVGTSTDGGRRWTVTNAGMPESAVTHIVMDPASPVGKRVLYACAFGRGVYKSSDNGKTWTLKNQGLEGRQPFAWRITRSEDGGLYLVVARRGGRGPGIADGALYHSADGAERWRKLALPAGTNGPMGLTLDPKDQRRMYLSAWGTEGATGDTGGGVFLSSDGGGTWSSLFQDSQHVYDLTVDGRNPRVLYVCGFDSGAWRSADAGATWQRIRGYNFKWGHRVIPDPTNASKIYITTYGGSVWQGPAAGDPRAAEDVLEPKR
jgi:photosystem II stability/assembly factor-like uncharacterized protein